MLRLTVVMILCLATTATAQTRRPSHCIAIADAAPGLSYIQKASFDAPIPDYTVRLTYLQHAMFLIQTQGGLNAITDYAGNLIGADFIPDVVTMNHAHDTHWTMFPDERIPHALQGWGNGPAGADHHLDLGEMLVRNVPTDIRGRFGGPPEINGNSIFVFEVAGLCIGHLGHLHHAPTDAQYAALGRLDVVMAAVDGGMTLPTETIVQILKRLKSSVVIPMHWFGRYTLDRFLLDMGDEFAIEQPGRAEYVVSLATLPRRPTIVVLDPYFAEYHDE